MSRHTMPNRTTPHHAASHAHHVHLIASMQCHATPHYVHGGTYTHTAAQSILLGAYASVYFNFSTLGHWPTHAAVCPHLYTAMHPLTCTMCTCVALLTHASVHLHLCTLTPWPTHEFAHTHFGPLVRLWACTSAHLYIGPLLQ